MPDSTLLTALRAATGSLHAALDSHPRLVPLAEGRIDPVRYGALLGALRAVRAPVECWIYADDGPLTAWLPDIAGRRLTGLLDADLDALGLEPTADAGTASVRAGGPGAALGAAYVLEGAGLGALMIGDRLRAAGDPAILRALRYFGRPREQVLTGWRGFVACCGDIGPPRTDPAWIEDASRAAADLFRLQIAAVDRMADRIGAT